MKIGENPCPIRLLIAVDEISQTAEYGTLLFARTGLGSRFVNSVCQPAERQRLQPHLARAHEAGKEDAFTTKEGGLHLSYKLDVIIHGRLKGHEAPGIDTEILTGTQLQRVDGSPGMDEAQPVPFEPLHDEAFTAEQADADLPLKGDPD